MNKQTDRQTEKCDYLISTNVYYVHLGGENKLVEKLNDNKY